MGARRLRSSTTVRSSGSGAFSSPSPSSTTKRTGITRNSRLPTRTTPLMRKLTTSQRRSRKSQKTSKHERYFEKWEVTIICTAVQFIAFLYNKVIRRKRNCSLFATVVFIFDVFDNKTTKFREFHCQVKFDLWSLVSSSALCS